MSTYNYVQVKVEASEHTRLIVAVPPWEVPILEAVHGSDKCEIVGETGVRRALPDPSVEFDRLVTRYGIDTENGQSLVGLVYGAGSIGVKRLSDEISKVRPTTADDFDHELVGHEPEEIEV